MLALVNFLDQTSGATAIEYALIASGIALGVMVTIFTLGGQVSGALTAIAAAIGA